MRHLRHPCDCCPEPHFFKQTLERLMARLRRALPKQLGATAVLLCALLAQSEGFFAAPNTPTTHSKLASDLNGRTNGHGQFVARSDSGSGGSSAALGAAGSRERLFETVTTLRGGSPAMKIPGYDAAAAAIAAISVPAIAWTGGPALFAQVRMRCGRRIFSFVFHARSILLPGNPYLLLSIHYYDVFFQSENKQHCYYVHLTRC